MNTKITLKSHGNEHVVTMGKNRLTVDTIGKALAVVYCWRAMFYMEGLK